MKEQKNISVIPCDRFSEWTSMVEVCAREMVRLFMVVNRKPSLNVLVRPFPFLLTRNSKALPRLWPGIDSVPIIAMCGVVCVRKQCCVFFFLLLTEWKTSKSKHPINSASIQIPFLSSIIQQRVHIPIRVHCEPKQQQNTHTHTHNGPLETCGTQ